MLAGYETYVRIGRLGSPDLLNAGWQPHSVLANFGAAAVAAKLYGLDAEQTLHALAIALSHASGTTEYASTGGSIKRVHAGMAVRNGIESAELARAGITGPPRLLTGDRGLYRKFIRKAVGDEARTDFLPGAPLMLRKLMFKAYCCCAANARLHRGDGAGPGRARRHRRGGREDPDDDRRDRRQPQRAHLLAAQHRGAAVLAAGADGAVGAGQGQRLQDAPRLPGRPAASSRRTPT